MVADPRVTWDIRIRPRYGDNGRPNRGAGRRVRELPTPEPTGCDNSTALADGDAVRQITGVKRLAAQVPACPPHALAVRPPHHGSALARSAGPEHA
jgi:hypothetical protein